MQTEVVDTPEIYPRLLAKSDEIGFGMPSDIHIGQLLKTLVASRPNGRFLELGTGIGLSLSWMVDGMNENAKLISLDNDSELVDIAKSFFQNDSRIRIECQDGGEWLKSYNKESFDLIFADAWPGKYSHLDETLHILKPGGFYVIDDMVPQPNWPVGHEEKANALIEHLEQRDDIVLTKMNWSTGILIVVKK